MTYDPWVDPEEGDVTGYYDEVTTVMVDHKPGCIADTLQLLVNEDDSEDRRGIKFPLFTRLPVTWQYGERFGTYLMRLSRCEGFEEVQNIPKEFIDRLRHVPFVLDVQPPLLGKKDV